MTGFPFDQNAIFNFDDVNANFDLGPDVFGEEEGKNVDQGTTSHSGEGAAGDTGAGNLINYVHEPFVGLGALMTNDSFDPARPVDENNDPFMAIEDSKTYSNSDPEHGQTQHQQVFQKSVGFNQNAGLAPETDQLAANFSGVEEEDCFKITNQEQDEAFHRLMEMSPEAFEEMMRGFPVEETTARGPSLATLYADSKKRVRLDEEGSASTPVGGVPAIPQLDFEPQQVQQIRQIREAKSRRGKAIEGLEKRVQNLVVDLAKAQSEAKDAFENGRMVALLGVDGSWEAKEAQLRQDAQVVHEQQMSAVRNILEGRIAEQDKQLEQYRAEAEEYKTSVEGEARKYEQAVKEEVKAQKAALKAAEGAKNKAENCLSEQKRVLDLAKPYAESLEKKIADLERDKANYGTAERLREQGPAIGALEGKIEELKAAAQITKASLKESEKSIERLNGANQEARNDHEDLKRVFENNQSYAMDLERKLANLEKEQFSKEAAQLQREEQLQQSATEAYQALEGRIKDLGRTAEKSIRAEEKATQATKSLEEELWRSNEDLNRVQSALKTKTDELERARSAIKEMAEAQYPKQQGKIQSIVGPIVQVDLEPSNPTTAKMLSAAPSFTFVAAKELPPLQIKIRPVHPKKSQRQLRPQRQPQPQTQLKKEAELEPKPTSPSQLGMFSRYSYPLVPLSRPRRIHIHAEEAIRNRFRIPLDKVHTIASKLDKIEDSEDRAGAADEAGLIIAAELTGLSIRDLKVMRSLRMSFPGSSNPRSVMRSTELGLPKTLVDLLASENRPTIRAFLDGASFPQSQASSEIVSDERSQGTQTEALNAEGKGTIKNIAVQEDEEVVQPSPKQSRCGSKLGFPLLWKYLIFFCVLRFTLPLLLSLPWSSPVAWLFEDPDPNIGWFDYVPPPSPWSSLIPDFSGWPVISKLLSSVFEDRDLESKWCGTIPMG